MNTKNLIARHHHRAAQPLSEKVRNRRGRALSPITKYRFVTPGDGRETREVIFDQPATVGASYCKCWAGRMGRFGRDAACAAQRLWVAAE